MLLNKRYWLTNSSLEGREVHNSYRILSLRSVVVGATLDYHISNHVTQRWRIQQLEEAPKNRLQTKITLHPLSSLTNCPRYRGLGPATSTPKPRCSSTHVFRQYLLLLRLNHIFIAEYQLFAIQSPPCMSCGPPCMKRNKASQALYCRKQDTHIK